MKKQMEPLTVSTRDGMIFIEQSFNGEDCGIAIHPEQIPTLVAWLNEAAAELQRDSEAGRPQ